MAELLYPEDALGWMTWIILVLCFLGLVYLFVKRLRRNARGTVTVWFDSDQPPRQGCAVTGKVEVKLRRAATLKVVRVRVKAQKVSEAQVVGSRTELAWIQNQDPSTVVVAENVAFSSGESKVFPFTLTVPTLEKTPKMQFVETEISWFLESIAEIDRVKIYDRNAINVVADWA